MKRHSRPYLAALLLIAAIALVACADHKPSIATTATAPAASQMLAAPDLRRQGAPAMQSTRTLDLDLQNEELATVLSDLSALSGIRFHHLQQTRGIRVTLSGTGLSYQEALDRLLVGFDTIVYRQARDRQDFQPVAVWILPRTHAKPMDMDRSHALPSPSLKTAAIH